MGRVHHAWTDAVSVQRRCRRQDLQARSGRQSGRLVWSEWQEGRTVLLGARDRLPERERALHGRSAELARSEADAASAGEIDQIKTGSGFLVLGSRFRFWVLGSGSGF